MSNHSGNLNREPQLIIDFKNNLDSVRFAPVQSFKAVMERLASMSLFSKKNNSLDLNSFDFDFYIEHSTLIEDSLKQYPLKNDGMSSANFKFWFYHYCAQPDILLELEDDTVKTLCHHLKENYISVIFNHPQSMTFFNHPCCCATLIEENNIPIIEKIFHIFQKNFQKLEISKQSSFKTMLIQFYLQSYSQHNEESLERVYECIKKTFGLDMLYQQSSLFENSDYIKSLIKINPEKYFPENPRFLHNLILEWSLAGNFENEPEYPWVLDYGISHLHHHYRNVQPLLSLWQKLTFEEHDIHLCYALLQSIDLHSPEDVPYLSAIFQKTASPQIKHMVSRFRLKQTLDDELPNNTDSSVNECAYSSSKMKI